MTHFYEDDQDYALRAKGPITGNWFSDIEDLSGMDIADFIEATYTDSADSEETEYRDERDNSDRMAERFGCWCILTARHILCATIYSATYNLRVCEHAVYTQHTYAAYTYTHHAVYAYVTQYMHTFVQYMCAYTHTCVTYCNHMIHLQRGHIIYKTS